MPGLGVRDDEQLVPAVVAPVECRSRPPLHRDESRLERQRLHPPASDASGVLNEGRDCVPRANTEEPLLGAQDGEPGRIRNSSG